MEGKSDPVRLRNISPAVSAQPMPILKEWHTKVTPYLRNHLVQRFVEAIYQIPDPNIMLDEFMHILVAYVKKVEGDMYGAANSRVSICNYSKQNHRFKVSLRNTRSNIFCIVTLLSLFFSLNTTIS